MTASTASIKTLGVTGGIGSGKSTVCRVLEDLGARVFYADAVAKRLMQEKPEIRADIIEAFGPESYDAEGKLNRKYLASQIFGGSKENLARMNAIVHPRVYEALAETKAAAAREGVRLLVHETALIFETGRADEHDAILVVDAPQDERVRRVVERDQTTPMHVLGRIGHQLPAQEIRRRADYVIDNDGTLEALREAAERVYHAVLEEA